MEALFRRDADDSDVQWSVLWKRANGPRNNSLRNQYVNVRRYQLGMPVWRALGNTVQTDLAGFAYIVRGDHTAVFVDARTPQEFQSKTVLLCRQYQAGEGHGRE